MFAPQSTNTSRVYNNRITVNSGDVPAGTFTGDETLTAYLYVGDPTAALATITASWDETNGPDPALEGQPIVSWEVTPTTLTAISNFEPGLYRYQVVANPSTDKRELARGFVQFVGGAAAVTAPSSYTTVDALKVYGTFDNLVGVARWLPNLITESPDMRSNLSEERARARQWLDGYLLGTCGYAWDRGTLKGYLDNDALMLTGPEGSRLLRAACLHAAALVMQPQIGKVPGTDTPYRTLAAEFFDEANQLVRDGPAWLDTDADGTGDVVLYPGRTRIVRG